MAFGRLTRPQGQRPFSDINMTPLIDVMLVLLIIFMVTAPLLTARLPLDLPKANAPLAATPPAALQVATGVSTSMSSRARWPHWPTGRLPWRASSPTPKCNCAPTRACLTAVWPNSSA